MKRILMVEDEPEIVRFLKRGLTYKGFEVVVATDGWQAMNAAHQCAPDLVLLDVMLPDMDGYEVCQRLRAEGKEALPVLMLTAKKEIIFERVWGYDNEAGLEIIKVYINSLRSKLNAGGKPDIIHTLRGVGYVLKPKPSGFLSISHAR